MLDSIDLLSAEVIRCGIQCTPVAGKFYFLEYLDGTMRGPWFYASLDKNRMCPDECLCIPDVKSPCRANPGMKCETGYFIDVPANT